MWRYSLWIASETQSSYIKKWIYLHIIVPILHVIKIINLLPMLIKIMFHLNIWGSKYISPLLLLSIWLVLLSAFSAMLQIGVWGVFIFWTTIKESNLGKNKLYLFYGIWRILRICLIQIFNLAVPIFNWIIFNIFKRSIPVQTDQNYIKIGKIN